MTKRIAPLLVLTTLAVILAGCGGGGKSSSGTAGGSSGGGTNGIAIGNCLNDANFLVQPETGLVDGQSPAGVSFTLKLYPTQTAAKAAAAKKDPKTSALVDNGVVDFHGNVSPYKGAPPAKISKVELAAIKSCIESAK